MQSKNDSSINAVVPDLESTDLTNSQNSSTATLNQTDKSGNPLASVTDDAELIVDSIRTDSPGTASNQSDSNQNSNQNSSNASELIVDSTPSSSGVEASSVAVEPLSDAEFIRLEQQIKSNRQLRLDLLEEFRYNTDPVRAQQLAALLGPYDDPEILQVASELAYSGDPQSRVAGLDLLSLIQPRNDEARDIAIDLLSTGDDTKMLVATMNVLARPTTNASDRQLQSLNDNLGNLSNHYEPTVRAQSLSLLERWDQNSAVARDAFSRGLTDPDPSVRSSATFALNNINNPDDAMISGLLSIAENTDENRSTRYAALRALEKMQLSGTLMRRFAAARISANRR